MTARGLERVLAAGQGGYYVATGIWPLVSLGSFERVTGPKTDGWLVKTVGVLVAAVGANLVMAGGRDAVSAETRLLATAGAAGLAAVEAVYATGGRISRIYLLDAAAEAALATGWVLTARRTAEARRRSIAAPLQGNPQPVARPPAGRRRAAA